MRNAKCEMSSFALISHPLQCNFLIGGFRLEGCFSGKSNCAEREKAESRKEKREKRTENRENMHGHYCALDWNKLIGTWTVCIVY